MNRSITLTLGVIVCVLAITVATAQVQPTNPVGTVNAPVKGTPYLDESYVEGTILFANNNRKAQMRYNAYKDNIEFQVDGQARVLDASSNIKKVNLGETTFVVEKYKDKDITKYGYFTQLDSGKVNLYSKKVMKFTPAMKNRGLDGGDQAAEFRRAPDEFYFKIAGGEMTEIKSIKSMISVFPDKQDELSAFAKKEKISPRKEAELVQLIEYYNSL